ncbi:DUF6993 domain-containing protein [Agrococcus beijingensis]|uniref:DUF6993 domain-containing protein n=1 Tax=Agrococcus beijingensis TaxID=3068634 RepID=UPI002740EBA8|nr:hypothetical protein [Agrococcus sp. REN33]
MRQLAAVALVAALALAGCTPAEPQPTTPSTEATSGSAAPGSVPTDPGVTAPATDAATDPQLDAFRAALEGQSPAQPDALVAAVEAAGFERSAIERTHERDSLDQPVTFVEIAVLLGESCLIGQVGDGEPLALRVAALGGGRCLVGDVIALD